MSDDVPDYGDGPSPVFLIAAPMGVGKTTIMTETVAEISSTCWLTNTHADVDAAVAAIEEAGGRVGRVLPLRGKSPPDAPDDEDAKNACTPTSSSGGRRKVTTTARASVPRRANAPATRTRASSSSRLTT